MKGRKSSMTEERVKMLEALDFSWGTSCMLNLAAMRDRTSLICLSSSSFSSSAEVRPSLERPRGHWQQRFDELCEYYKKNGDFKISPDTMPQLHSWCQEQKFRLSNIDKNGKNASKQMGPERVKALDDIGFTKDTELGTAASATSAGSSAGAGVKVDDAGKEGSERKGVPPVEAVQV